MCVLEYMPIREADKFHTCSEFRVGTYPQSGGTVSISLNHPRVYLTSLNNPHCALLMLNITWTDEPGIHLCILPTSFNVCWVHSFHY